MKDDGTVIPEGDGKDRDSLPATAGMPGFPTTRWTLIQQAEEDGTVGADALEQICHDYWYPLYVFARRKGNSPEDAMDLTQGYFETAFLRGRSLARADRNRGRMRSYLLGGLKHFMASEWRKATAAKRGGGAYVLSIDGDEAEGRFIAEPADDSALSPDAAFDRRWALDLLDRVLKRLESEQEAKGKSGQFDCLAPYLAWNSDGATYVEVGVRLGISEGAVKVAVHRLRQRYGDLLREEIAQTVNSTDDIEEELEVLLAALG